VSVWLSYHVGDTSWREPAEDRERVGFMRRLSLGVTDAMALIQEKVSRLVPFTTCALFLGDDEQGFACRYAHGPGTEALFKWAPKSWSDLSLRIPSCADGRGSRGEDLTALLPCPLKFEGRLIGVPTSRRRRRIEERHAQSGGAGEELGAQVGRRSGQRSLEELANDPEREFSLELAATGTQHLEAAAPRARPRLGQQSRLTEPRSTLDDHETAVAAASCVEHRLERRKLGLSLQQQSRSR
jgi:hypothetical protein